MMRDLTTMPKLIKNAKENIIKEAKALLLTEGFSALNMRTIAERVGVAAGTLYNYFPSKEYLVVSIMLEDWETMLAELEKSLPNVQSAIEGLETIFNAIQSFSDHHRSTWQNLHQFKEFAVMRRKYHGTLIDQLGKHLLPLGNRFGFLFDETVAPFLAEVLLAGGSYPNGKFHFLAPCLQKIVGEA